MNGFTCATCGEYHPELPMVLGPASPFAWEQIPAADREARGEISSDQCVIDEKHFFLRGRLEIPVKGSPQPFTWLVWVSVSREDFVRAYNLWHEAGREKEPPYEAELQSALPYAHKTLDLSVRLHTRPVGERPFVEVVCQPHPLYEEQQHAVSIERVQKIVEVALHA